MRRASLVAVLTAGFLVSPQTASAITGAELDGTMHPNVAALVGHPPEGGLAIGCSGVLIAPRIVLTAGHCTASLAEEPESPFVTFDPTFEPGRSRLWPVAELITHPGFDPVRLTNDLGVVVLARSVRNVSPVMLPAADLLGALAATKTLPDELTMVSYGVFVDCSVRPCAFVDDGARRVAAARLGVVQSTLFGVFNGVCSHDSGSPQLLPSSNVVVGITNIGFGCTATGQAVRLDTTAARSFLGSFVQLP